MPITPSVEPTPAPAPIPAPTPVVADPVAPEPEVVAAPVADMFAADPEPPKAAAPPHRRRRRRWLGLVIVLVVLAAAVGGVLYYSSKQGETPASEVSPPKREAIHKTAQYYCSFTARALLCQVIKDGKTTKYRLPDSFGNVVTVLPSPDGKKLLIQTAASPVDINDTGRILVTDTSFKVGKELPKDPAMAYSSIAWADDSTIAVARRTIASGKTTVGMYSLSTEKTEDLQLTTNGFFGLQSSATGDFVYVEEHLNDKLKLSAIAVASRKVVDIDSTQVLAGFTTYDSLGYDYVSDLFYLAGTAKGNKPQLVIAKLGGTDKLSLSVQKTIDDDTVYTPLAAADGGMLVSQEKKDGTLGYGVLDGFGKFTDKPIKPSVDTAFGLVDLPTAKAVDKPDIESGDFLGGVANAPQALQTLVGKIVTNPACISGTFNAATLLGHDDTQAAVLVKPCNDQISVLQYYSLQGGNYVQLGTSTNIPPLCHQVESLKLSKAVAPTCKNDH